MGTCWISPDQRHPPIGWESTPSPVEEIEAAQDHLADIVRNASGCHKVWTLGNHDARFETRLAMVAREYKGLKGSTFRTFLVLGPRAGRLDNDDVVCKHRWKGGIHAPYNNVVYAGKTMVTGHLHSEGSRHTLTIMAPVIGVDTGCVAGLTIRLLRIIPRMHRELAVRFLCA